MEDNWVMESIKPKSDQLNADDLITGPIVVTVEDVKRGDPDQPIVLVIDGGRQPYKPCKSMRRVIIKIWGEKPKDWIGKRLKLFCDPDVKWAGVKCGGIRISGMSGLARRQSVMLTLSRGKRAEYIIEPIEDAPPKADEQLKQRIAGLKEYAGTFAKHLADWADFAQWSGIVLDKEGFQVANFGTLTEPEVAKLEAAAKELEPKE